MKSKKIMLYLHSVTREVNMAVKSWEVSDEFWARVAPLIPKVKRDPKKSYQRRRGGGRKPMESRRIFEAIIYVLRTGIQWKALPKEYGSSKCPGQRGFISWWSAPWLSTRTSGGVSVRNLCTPVTRA